MCSSKEGNIWLSVGFNHTFSLQEAPRSPFQGMAWALAKLGNSKFVRILIDGKGKRLAIQVCEENDHMATLFSKSDKPEGVRWNTKDLNQTILNMTGWTFDEKKQCYKVEGTYVEDEDGPALIFDLNDAQVQD